MRTYELHVRASLADSAMALLAELPHDYYYSMTHASVTDLRIQDKRLQVLRWQDCFCSTVRSTQSYH